MLTEDQRELLRRASSNMLPGHFTALEKEEQEFYIKRVEAAIAAIQAESPSHFLFKYVKGDKKDIVELMLDRNFYHAPTNTNQFASANSHKVVFQNHLKFKEWEYEKKETETNSKLL